MSELTFVTKQELADIKHALNVVRDQLRHVVHRETDGAFLSDVTIGEITEIIEVVNELVVELRDRKSRRPAPGAAGGKKNGRAA
jgi:hypothetical protein